MDNLDKLINDLSGLLEKKYTEQRYLISSNLSVNVTPSEIFQNWCCFLNKNNIELICVSSSNKEDVLLNLINREQHKIKNKIIFPMYGFETEHFYVLTDRQNAQKLVVLGSFEN